METRTKRQRTSRLLIVEDDETQLKTLTDIMQAEGFEVTGCSTATSALELIEDMDRGVVVLDLRLPDLSGTQLLEKLNEVSGKVRVIIHTAYCSYKSAKDALNLGAFGYVEKGGDSDVLIHCVHKAFGASLQSYADELEEAVAERTRNLLEVNRSLEEERYKLREYFENLPALAYNITFDGKIEDCNQVAVKTLGYVLKTYLFDDLCSAIRSAAAGNHYLSPAITGVVVSEYVHGGSADQSGSFRLLTSREREIIQLVAEGKTTKQVALTLHLSHKTADSARRAAMAKLGISSVAELTKFAIREGITSVGC